ncbi:MAG TPA: spermidine/putrescine ABC transporter substrate-binding protein, partial [Gammaproteobacteria bacterium]|nr:spermidine/putrescine ABC transporter substrate-binding protein [Gammaproteobacteria bacterium]
FSLASHATKQVVNVYAWAGEIPDVVIQQFEKETGINVNLTTYENNEVMYAKLRATGNPGYDIILPSSYFVDRMRKQNMLEKLDTSKLSNFKYIDPTFLHPAYDPKGEYSVPFIWGVTGIFVNQHYYSPNTITGWSTLWEPRFKNQLMLLNDMRELFSVALLSLGYSANDRNPDHIKAAFIKLQALMPNVKVFASDAVTSIIIDEDATIGAAWNGDAFKAYEENSNIQFIYPKEGFVIWVDTLAIPFNAPHKDNAYAFINFLLRPDIAAIAALQTKFATANLAARKMLPDNIRNNTTVYPGADIMKHGQFQTDLGEETLGLLEEYWETLKMGG